MANACDKCESYSLIAKRCEYYRKETIRLKEENAKLTAATRKMSKRKNKARAKERAEVSGEIMVANARVCASEEYTQAAVYVISVLREELRDAKKDIVNVQEVNVRFLAEIRRLNEQISTP